MNRSGMVCACALMLSAAVPADTAVWLPEGTGGWSSPERWEDGKVPTPSAESPWTVKIPDDASAVVTDADKAYFEALGQLTLGSNSVLTVTNDADLALSCPLTAGLDMHIVKLGSGTFTLKYAVNGHQFNTEKAGSRWEVRDGVLAVDSCGLSGTLEFRCPVGVWSPGVLRLDSARVVQMRGLYGDGTVQVPEDTSAEYLTFAKNTLNSPNDFSGSFTGMPSGFYLSLNAAYQKFSNPATVTALTASIRLLNDAHLAVAALPEDDIAMRSDAQIEYIGSETSVAGSVALQNSARHAKFNAGPDGGTEFTTEFSPVDGKMCIYEFTGDNLAASVFNGALGFGDSECAAFLKKTGSGTWRFTGAAGGNNGTVAVEQGRLEFETAAERGSVCSLGTANVTHSEYTGDRDDTKAVPYASLIGNGENDASASVPVLAYAGSSRAYVTNRCVAVKGAGGFSAEGAVLDWTGFSSVQSGDNTLVLGGAALGSVARNVTDGAGRLSVVKDGAGTWTLDGNIGFSGGVTVKEGTLRLNLAQHYRWFRIVFKRSYYASAVRAEVGHIAFFDAAGNDLSLGTVYNANMRGKNGLLPPLQCTLDADETSHASYWLDGIFESYTEGMVGRITKSPAGVFDLEDDSTWVHLTVRLRSDVNHSVKYDMVSPRVASGKPSLTTPRDWELYGSTDGATWEKIHEQSDLRASRSDKNYWLSDRTVAVDTPNPTGFPFSRTEALSSPYVKLQSVASVSVSEGATLVSDKSVPAGGIVFDASEGAGTMDGFSFPETGCLEIKGRGADMKLAGTVEIPFTFRNCTDVSNIAKWTLSMDGEDVKEGEFLISAGPSGITAKYLPPGFQIVIR